MNYVFFTLIARGGMAATNCDSVLRKCSFTMHIRFCMRSLIRPNAKSQLSQLNLAWIDSSPVHLGGQSQHGEYLPTAQYGPPIGVGLLPQDMCSHELLNSLFS